jgi:hypothetical protein
MTTWWTARMAQVAHGDVAARREALFALLADLRAGAVLDRGPDGDGLVRALVAAMNDADGYNAGRAADALRTIAQYRRGDISAAGVALARAVTHPQHQELRKESGEALVELAENGPGIDIATRAALSEATQHPMKHARQLATYALAADAVARADLAAWTALVDAHPRSDVRERAFNYVCRGAEWRDASFAVPLVLGRLTSADRTVRTRAVSALTAIFVGPRSGGAVSAARCARAQEAVEALDAAGEALADIDGVDTARGWAARVAAEVAQIAWMGPMIGALQEGGAGAARAREAMRRLDANQRVGLVDAALDRRAWGVLAAWLADPDRAVVADVLQGLDYASLRRMMAFTPLVPALVALLEPPSSDLTPRAVSVLHNLAHAGSATDRTEVASAVPALTALAEGAGPAAAMAGQVLFLARTFGGLGPPSP